MKKRLVRKWINRYLTPIIQDIPIQHHLEWIPDDCGTQYRPKGECLTISANTHPRAACIQIRNTLLRIKKCDRQIYLRKHPAYTYGELHMQMIAES